VKDGTELYPVESRETIAETPELRARILTLAPGQCVPWHCHTRVDDTFFCIEGPVRIETLDPGHVQILQPGDTFVVLHGTPHSVAPVGRRRAKYVVFQGVGSFDFEPVEQPKTFMSGPVDVAPVSSWIAAAKAGTDRTGADDPWQAYTGNAIRHEILAKVATLSLHSFDLGAWHCRPWHYHNQITDTFFCRKGPMRVMTRRPDETHILSAGEIFAVPAKTEHFVSGVHGCSCAFFILQGVGNYDYVPIGHDGSAHTILGDY
jgi:quercetin dioxygenase-like cupin family protein